MRDVYLTPAGRKRLADRIHATRAAYLARSAENPDALQSGDSSGWHDNFAFEENMRQMHQLARQVRDLEDLLLRVIVVRPPKEADRVRYDGYSWRYESPGPNPPAPAPAPAPTFNLQPDEV